MRIVLASKSGVRKEILKKNKIDCDVEPSNVDEDEVKAAMLNENATPTLISKNLAELKANKVSNKNPDRIVLGADSVIDFEGELISKPKSLSLLNISFLGVVVVFVKNRNFKLFFLNSLMASIDPVINLLSLYRTPSKSINKPLTSVNSVI